MSKPAPAASAATTSRPVNGRRPVVGRRIGRVVVVDLEAVGFMNVCPRTVTGVATGPRLVKGAGPLLGDGAGAAVVGEDDG
jgi:hypothetical protein